VLSTTVDGVAGKAFTIAGMGKYAELALKVLTDDLTLPQSPGKARVRVIQATTTAPSLDVGVAGGDSIAKGVAFAQTTGYQEVAAGRWTLVAGPPGAAGHELPVTLSEGAVYTVLLVDKNGRLATQLYTDAKGPDAIPSGGIETGLGGTAPSSPSAGVLGVVGMLVAGAASAALVAAVRRRSVA
jgi:hypothetical protein